MATENKSRKASLSVWIAAVAVIASAIILGVCAYSGLKRVSMGERVVTVKGKAELTVQAEEGRMPINFSVGNDNLQSLLADANEKKTVILGFLKELGFKDNEIRVGKLSVNESDYTGAKYRFNGSQQIIVKSKQVKKIFELESRVSELYSKGVVVNEGYWGGGAEYNISDISDIKAKLITESMKNAREAGERFASDAQSSLGKMKTAWQGQIEINNADEATPYEKTCRVVSTITYYLED